MIRPNQTVKKTKSSEAREALLAPRDMASRRASFLLPRLSCISAVWESLPTQWRDFLFVCQSRTLTGPFTHPPTSAHDTSLGKVSGFSCRRGQKIEPTVLGSFCSLGLQYLCSEDAMWGEDGGEEVDKIDPEQAAETA